MVEASSTRATTAATATGTRRLRVNFARRYAALGGRARTGSSRARLWRFDLADDPLDLAIGFAAQLLGIKRRGAGQQLVEQHAEAVDVAAGIDVKAADVGLLGGHVLGRAYELAKLGEQRFVGEALAVRRLGDAEVDYLRDRRAVVQRHKDVGRLQVAVNHALLMGMLNGPADLSEQFQLLAGAEARLGYGLSIIDNGVVAGQGINTTGFLYENGSYLPIPKTRWARSRI